jgi:hypothetical protein
VGIAAASNTPILKSQRKPKDFRNPTIKTDRSLTRDSSYVAEFVKTPTRSKTQRSNSRTRKPRCSTVFACLSTERTTALRCATSCSLGGSRDSQRRR